MLIKRARNVLGRQWIRIALAAVLLFAGMAQIGAPVLSDNAVRQSLGMSGQPAAAFTYVYRVANQPDGTARVERSEVGSSDWTEASTMRGPILQLASSQEPGHQTEFARTAGAILRSVNAGSSWTVAGGLPGKPLSLAVASGAADLVLVGTDSSGLYLSSDQGTSWRPASGPLSLDGAGAVAVSALSVNPADDQVSYAISTYTMATPEGVHSIQAAYVSVDDARHWFTMAVERPVPVDMAISSLGPNVQLYPVAGQLLAVSAAGPSSMQTFELVLGPELLNGLEAPDAGLRAAAASAMGLTGDADAVAPLLRHIKDPDQAAGDRAAEALGHLGDSAAVPALRAALSDSNEAVRGRAAYALGLLQDTASIPALFNMLRSDGPLARNSAASGLAAMGTPEAIWALVQQLSASGLTPQGQVAMQALEEVGPSAAPQVIGALRSPDTMARRNAAELLGYMTPPQAVPALAQALSDPDAEVRAQAAWALGGIGTVPAQQALAQTMAVTQDISTRQAATQALAQAQQMSSQREPMNVTLASAAMHALSQLPASRWTFLLLLALFAATLLAFSAPRKATGSR
jgi:HEAT repeat protein